MSIICLLWWFCKPFLFPAHNNIPGIVYIRKGRWTASEFMDDVESWREETGKYLHKHGVGADREPGEGERSEPRREQSESQRLISRTYAGILALPQQGEGDDDDAVGATECELSGGDYDALDQPFCRAVTQYFAEIVLVVLPVS